MLYLSLGSNLGERDALMHRALRLLEERIGRIEACSSMYETTPVDFDSPHMFLNAAVALRCEKTADEVLQITRQIEQEMGRTVKSADGVYADRCIDIDMLMLDEACISTPVLTLPHPRMHERRFVLEPLCEIAPNLRHPVLGKSIRELLIALNAASIEEISEPSADVLASINTLLPQLSATAPPLCSDLLNKLLATHGTHLYALRDEQQRMVGMATLCLCSSPTGTKAWVEDVVVDQTCRRRGYARQLMSFLMDEAGRLGAKSVNLTSRPSRVAANRLYVETGFCRRDTNVYCAKLHTEAHSSNS